MNEKKAQLADLYFESGTVKFGAFKLSIHQANPDLPLSPVYLHYPKPGEAGDELLPQVYDLIGELFNELIENPAENIHYDRIVGIPEGAMPLAANLAKRRPDWPQNLVEFKKHVDDAGNRSFSGPSAGESKPGDNLLVVEDHTSGGYNKSLFIKAAKDAELEVVDILTVVDREQGGPAYLKSVGVTMHSVFTLSELLEYYVEKGTIEAVKADEVKAYIRDNQITV